MRVFQQTHYDCGTKDWILKVLSLSNQGIVTSLTDGTVRIFQQNGSIDSPLSVIKAHSSTINGMAKVDRSNVISTCASDSIKIWDPRKSITTPTTVLNNGKSFLSLDSNYNWLLAAGTELQGVDAEVYIWDLRNTKETVRSYVDSHHDDVTEIKFHQTNKDLLLSGSTDGYVNIYDMKIADEEDALHQVINFASIHSANFISKNRIATLSHMETFAIHGLNEDESEELTQPLPSKDFGDVRELWNCEYVVDIYPGYVACGANSRSELTLYPFDAVSETIDLSKPVWLAGAHGEEVVRSVCYVGEMIYSGGEDGCLRVWKAPPKGQLQVMNDFFGEEKNYEQVQDKEMEIEHEMEDIKKDKSSKEKKSKKDKSSDKDKKKKKKKDIRFKPY
ncbi:hypothetical protein PACTADRAFT_48450 [Pachysolen tannophilus NRRL Y-2460]|uniref:Uncharacterized protein n=1 Tax=Pachysolen tannophilus NRRL Y-2460 TaxID=669874 RepID=A0A1E4TY27_PACTA|nr:hypothetical protein PACTADRAFT_48450 [Pachysolen tannophilus NRRL Y-2460]